MNLFAEFRRLIPHDGVIVCTVQAEFGDGTTSCLTLDAHLVRVQGTNGRATGAKVFVQGGRVIGDAPALIAYAVEI